MLTIPRSVRILIGSTPIDMRKSIDALLRRIPSIPASLPTASAPSALGQLARAPEVVFVLARSTGRVRALSRS